ncbi:MAG: hypothetical protein KAS53_09450 [Candidatus Cloacimonetes bacterium]|nr:hypothetical protein [Candidatus Cloacimonadota bacterium]
MSEYCIDDFNKLRDFINFFEFDLSSSSKISQTLNICAVLAEVVLQSGMNYNNVVRPRIVRILKNYPDLNTIDKMNNVLDFNKVQEILIWKGKIRIKRFLKLVFFLNEQRINSTDELKLWLSLTSNQNQLLELEGIGPKSLDYLKLLVGISTIPIDRHLSNFAEMSGVSTKKYDYLSNLYKQVCKYLKVEYHILDSAIWNFMNSLLV